MADSEELTLIRSLRGDAALLRTLLEDLSRRVSLVEVRLIEVYDALRRLEPES